MKRSPLAVTGSILIAACMSTGLAFAQTPETIHPDASGSVGGSKSERAGESGAPLSKDSPFSGTVDKGKTGSVSSSQSRANRDQTIHPDASGSVGGSRSERVGESGAPLPKDSPFGGTVEMGARHNSMDNVKQAQQALKEKGYDPGPIDGVMGARTKEAIKSFQNASNLQVTGTLDSKTSQELGISSGSSSSMKSRSNVGSDENMTDKQTHEPNLPPQAK
jgi:putative peptidoglycan binding protein